MADRSPDPARRSRLTWGQHIAEADDEAPTARGEAARRPRLPSPDMADAVVGCLGRPATAVASVVRAGLRFSLDLFAGRSLDEFDSRRRVLF